MAVTDDCVVLDRLLPMAAETVVGDAADRGAADARELAGSPGPKPIVTAWILEESTALTLTLPLLPAVIRTLAI